MLIRARKNCPQRLRTMRPHESLQVGSPDWESPEHHNRAVPLVFSLSIVGGIVLVVFLVVALRARDQHIDKGPIASSKSPVSDVVGISSRSRAEQESSEPDLAEPRESRGKKSEQWPESFMQKDLPGDASPNS